jgi:glycosyltransferase involved in cell wall biosynthesis
MRIAIVSAFGHVIGGCEVYLRAVIPALAQAGEEPAFFHEHAGGPNEPKVLTTDVLNWCTRGHGLAASIEGLRAWHPDVIYAHGLTDAETERMILEIAPAVRFLHGYQGACISGTRLWRRPIHPCHRRFGPGCLLAYYPRRCGGLNPFVMWREYRRNQGQLALLRRYRALLVHSDHLASTLQRQGIAPGIIFKVPFPVGPPALRHEPDRCARPAQPWRLLFLGRHDRTKGGQVLLEALPHCLDRLGGTIELDVAGSGTASARWERRARQLVGRFPRLTIRFPGWIDADRQATLIRDADLLVFPSLWPEPFGMAGVEAVRAGLPVVAFDVGGIREWLQPGRNGWLAPGDFPTPEGLAAAIVQGLTQPLSTRNEARESDDVRFEMKTHLSALRPILRSIAQTGVGRPEGWWSRGDSNP